MCILHFYVTCLLILCTLDIWLFWTQFCLFLLNYVYLIHIKWIMIYFVLYVESDNLFDFTIQAICYVLFFLYRMNKFNLYLAMNSTIYNTYKDSSVWYKQRLFTLQESRFLATETNYAVDAKTTYWKYWWCLLEKLKVSFISSTELWSIRVSYQSDEFRLCKYEISNYVIFLYDITSPVQAYTLETHLIYQVYIVFKVESSFS